MSVTEVHGALGLDKLKNRTFQIFKVGLKILQLSISTPNKFHKFKLHISGQCYERRRLGREYGMAEQHAAEQEIEIFGSGVAQKWSACRL